MQNHITLEWADGSYNFRLPWAACVAIEQKSDAGIQAIYERVMIGQAHLSDVSEIIRQGLLGGAGGESDEKPVECKPVTVERLLKTYVTGESARPFVESLTVARTVLHTFMQGYEPPAGEGSKKKHETESDQIESI